MWFSSSRPFVKLAVYVICSGLVKKCLSGPLRNVYFEVRLSAALQKIELKISYSVYYTTDLVSQGGV